MDYFQNVVVKSEVYERGEAIENVLKKLTGEIHKLCQGIQDLSALATSTGMTLSVPTLENLQHLFEGKPFRKINPYVSNYKVFQEVLGIDIAMALKIERFFSHPEGKRLQDIEGVNSQMLEKISKYFLIDEGGIDVRNSS